MPYEHGNGGCYGSEVLAHVSSEWILKQDPVALYLEGDYDPMFGSRLRLCWSKDPNDAVYLWDHEERRWEKMT